jgi:starvation-inducible DNA-binding protein
MRTGGARRTQTVACSTSESGEDRQATPAPPGRWRLIGERDAIGANGFTSTVMKRTEGSDMPIQRWENEGGRTHATTDRNSQVGVPRPVKTSIDLPPDKRRKLVALLNQQLADTLDLFGQAQQAHWNVKGTQFFQLHELFADLAEQVLVYVDLIAERATALGGTALGTVRMSAAASRLTEYPLDVVEGRHVEALAHRFAALAATTRAAIGSAEKLGDADTADLVTEVSRGLDKGLWFLEAHLQE